MKAPNLLFILSDEHTRAVAGCYGDGIVRTPNIDRLARRGVIFDNAYTPCPICIPARAALATGLPVHQTGCWDNGMPYHGTSHSWGHRLGENGIIFDAVGKLYTGLSRSKFRRALAPGGDYVTVHMKRVDQPEDLIALKELIEAGKMKPVIDRTYPLAEIAQAHRYAETKRKKGNVVITVREPGE